MGSIGLQLTVLHLHSGHYSQYALGWCGCLHHVGLFSYPITMLIDVLLWHRMANFSMVVSGSAAITYLMDTHGHNALDVLAISNFSTNIVLYGFTFFANSMVLNWGVKVSLLILAACQAICWLASIPMYIYGKRVRSFVSLSLRIVSAVVNSTAHGYRLLDIQISSFLTKGMHESENLPHILIFECFDWVSV
jgi:hypothetical protein